MYHLYILKCSDATLYTGITTDLVRRVQQHNAGKLGAKYTQVRRPVKLVYSRKFRTKSAALKAEHAMKKLSRASKVAVIAAQRHKKHR